MNNKLEKQIQSILALLNSFEFIQPKLNNIQEITNGYCLKQILQHLLDIDIEIEVSDNWEMQMKAIKDLWNAFQNRLQLKVNPNFLQIVKNNNVQFILEMITMILQGIIHSEFQGVIVQTMMSLDQETQLILMKLMEQEQNLTIDQNTKLSEDILHKFEELESENQKLNQDLLFAKQEMELEKKKHQDNIEIMQNDLDRASKNIQILNDDLNVLYELTQTNTQTELCEYINNKNEDIKGMQIIIQSLRNDQQQEKNVHEEIVRDLRNQLEIGHRKFAQMQKLEKYSEQLKTQLTEALQEQTRNKENLKLNSKLKEENLDLSTKVNQLQSKLDQQKQIQKSNLKQQNQFEFDLQKARSENESLSRQLRLREQEIFKLKQEIIEQEHIMHNRTEQSQLENSSIIINGEESRNFSGIFTPKRNLGLELSQLITKANCLVEGDQKVKLDVHTQTDDSLEKNILLKKQDSSFDEELISSQLSFWKTQCQDLVAERVLYEEKQYNLEKEMSELKNKLEQFFNEQYKYEQELQEAREKILNLIEEKNVITNQFELSLQKIAKLDKELCDFPQTQKNLEECQVKLQKLEEKIVSKKNKKEQSNPISSIINKQLEITTRTYEELLKVKQEELQLLGGKFLGQSARFVYVFNDKVIVNKDTTRKKADRIFSIENTKRIVWKYSSEQPSKIKSILFDCNTNQQEYFGEEDVLRQLKNSISKVFFQAKVQEEYVALQVIGQGNYALVLELKHLHSEKKFASKCIDKKKLQTLDQGMESVLNEIDIMRTLSPNPQLINLLEVYEGDNNIYLIMDLAYGGSLYKEMKGRLNLYSRKDVQKIMYQILTGLSYIHSKNIMHRDLKPENILFVEKGKIETLKIADFGLSAKVNQLPYIYPKCGTPGFVAPEIVNLIDKTQPYTSHCDIFSAGVIFHILLTGEGLFIGNGHQEILKANKECHIDLQKQKYQNLDSDAKNLLIKMLEINPNQRFTAQQCLDHPYFQNESAPSLQLIKETSQKNGFDLYLDTYNSPDQKQMNRSSKKLSIVTRTPIYAPKASTPQLHNNEHQIMEELSPCSSFSLDQIRNETTQQDKFLFTNTK